MRESIAVKSASALLTEKGNPEVITGTGKEEYLLALLIL
jgi:hypothetical protein